MPNLSSNIAQKSTLIPSASALINSDIIETSLPLHSQVEQAVREYFSKLDGGVPCNLYETVLNEIEKPLLSVVLEQTNGNQTQTAKILGLNRGTLRKKMAQHDLL